MVPKKTQMELAWTAAVCGATLIAYYVFFGSRHRNSRKQLRRDLEEAEQKVQALQAQLDEKEEEEAKQEDNTKPKERKKVRIFLDGAFDMMHYGHMNAFRQGKALGDFLVVGECESPKLRYFE
jgi:ethanolamine-phosphate cytidylyltransferase